MATSEKLYQNRIEHLLRYILYIEKSREILIEYTNLDNEAEPFEPLLIQFPYGYPAKFLDMTIPELSAHISAFCNIEYKFFEAMEMVWGEDGRHSFDIYWLDYELDIIADFYFERHITREEAYQDAIGLRYVKKAKNILSVMVQLAIARDEIIPADLLVFLPEKMAEYRAQKELVGNSQFQEIIYDISKILSLSLNCNYNILL